MTRSILLLSLSLAGGLLLGCGDKEPDDSSGADDSSDADDSAADDSAADDSGPTAEDCGNGVDDDADGLADCDDSDCAAEEACQPAEDCAAPGDEDANGLADCADAACADDAACSCVDGGSLGNGTGANLASGDAIAFTDDFQGDCGSDGGVDIAYAWTAPADGCYTFDTDGSEYDTVLRLFPACGAEEAACNDDSEFGLQSLVSTGAVGGSAWIIVVDAFSASSVSEGDTGFDSGAGGRSLYSLNISSTSPVISASGATDLGSAVGASVASGDNSASTASGVTACGGSPGASVTFTWTAPSSGAFTFDSYGSSFDTILGLFDPQGCGELSCDDDGLLASNNESEFSASVVGGHTYIIELSGYGGETGTYVININPAD